jgi:hypothetical protein
VFCPSIQCPAIEYSFSARGCLGELDRVLGLGEPFLGELKLVLELVEGFLEELKLVLEIVEFFCLLVQQPCLSSDAGKTHQDVRTNKLPAFNKRLSIL